MNADSYVKEFVKNDYSRFNEFYNLTKKQVYFTALSVLKDEMLAEDVLQETYVSFLETVDGYKYGSNVYSYLTVIARNKSINVYNRQKRLVFNEDALITQKHEVDFDGERNVKDILSLLHNDVEREIVTYHVILGYKFIEIAKILSMPLGTVLWRYNKAIKTLREKVGVNL
ncbi:MAG: RNA polymerase sigma factor [Clostridia bacterium]|nr:RNA polymerase sigma factor [Clostridia bacterium]